LTQYNVKASLTQLEISNRDLIFEHEFRQKIDETGSTRWRWTPVGVDLLRKSGEFFVMKEDLDDQTEAANEGI
jgi:hypothetical protein